MVSTTANVTVSVRIGGKLRRFTLVNRGTYKMTAGRQIGLSPLTGAVPGSKYLQMWEPESGAILLMPVDE